MHHQHTDVPDNRHFTGPVSQSICAVICLMSANSEGNLFCFWKNNKNVDVAFLEADVLHVSHLCCYSLF